MSQLERAIAYIGIFYGAGDRWRGCVPVDSTPGEGDSIHLGGVRIALVDGVWQTESNGEIVRYKVAEKVAAK